MDRQDELLRIVRQTEGDEDAFMAALVELARRDVQDALDEIRTADTGTSYEELAALGRRLASAAGLVAAESEQR
jgi:hypothetical protein